jgi:type III pantothenate kinase
MLLAIDAGNSFVKFAYHDGQVWQERQRVALNDFCIAPGRYLQQLPDQIIIANVTGPLFQQILESAFPSVSMQWVKAASLACGVKNQYDAPEQLGSDRWAMLIAARALMKQSCVVASLGTALTVDTLTAEGVFLGGVIAPGLQLMHSALESATHAVLPSIGKISRFPTNTADAVETGLVYAILGVIEKTLAEFETHIQRPVMPILTGGGAHLIAPYLNRPVQVVDNLVLDGLLLLFREEKRQ